MTGVQGSSGIVGEDGVLTLTMQRKLFLSDQNTFIAETHLFANGGESDGKWLGSIHT